VVVLLARFDLWDASVLKETIYWVIGTGLVMFGSFDKVQSVKGLYKETFTKTIKVAVILEFFIGFYVFPIWVELLFLPFIALVSMMSAYVNAQKSKEYASTKKFFGMLTAFVGITVLVGAINAFISNPKPLFTFQNLELFLLPMVLSLSYVISVYFISLYSKYELAFLNIDHFLTISRLDRIRVKLQVIKRCGFSVKKVGDMMPYLAINLHQKTTTIQALRVVAKFCPNEKSM
jgi:hypothetical protein